MPNWSSVSCACDFLRGGGTGTKNSDGRRLSSISSVGWPSAITKCRFGSTNGELMTGFSIAPVAVPCAKRSLSPPSIAGSVLGKSFRFRAVESLPGFLLGLVCDLDIMVGPVLATPRFLKDGRSDLGSFRCS